MITEIETYLNSLFEDILTLNIRSMGIKSLPDLTRFKNLKTLNCSNNQLTSLPTLPQNLEVLYCYDNQLTYLPTLPQNLKTLSCYDNLLTYLPTLPQNLEKLYCSNNQLTWLHTLSQNLETLSYINNPIYEIISYINIHIYEIVNDDSLFHINQNIKIFNNFRHLCYCLKFKQKFRKWLWEKVREPNIKNKYNPKYLIENLKEEDDLDTFLDNWKKSAF